MPDIDSIGEITRISDGLSEISVDKGFNLKSGDQVKELQGQSHELTDLRNENAKLKAETSELAIRLEALEKTVVRAEAQPGEVHPVALNQ